MEKKKIIWLGLIGGAYLLITRIRRVVSGLAWRFAGIQILSANNEQNSCMVDMRLQIRNTTSISLLLNSIVGEIFMQGVKVGDVNQAFNQMISKRSISVVDIIFDLYWKGVADGIRANVLSGNIRNLNFQFVGYIEVEGRKIAVDQLITYQDLVG